MSEESTEGSGQAVVRRSRWPGWIWAVPIAAAMIVGWLGIRWLLSHGPEVTVTFADAAELKPGDSKVQYRGALVGEVESVDLASDMSHVTVTLGMNKDMKSALREGTRFWIAGANPTLTDLGSLKSVIGGPFVEMDPGPGRPTTHFQGLDKEPAVRNGAQGSRFVLTAAELGAIASGTKITYKGASAGVVESTRLAADGRSFQIGAFIDAPYDKLIHSDTRFWKESPVEVSTANGFQARVGPLSTLLSGGIAFANFQDPVTPASAQPGQAFRLYDGRDQAENAGGGRGVAFLVRFSGVTGDLTPGAPVKLRGFRIGRVTSVSLAYDGESGKIETPVRIEIDPAALEWTHMPKPRDGNWAPVVADAMDRLIRSGLRAGLDRSVPLIGAKLVSLDFQDNAAPASLIRGGGIPEIPAGSSGDIKAIAAQVQSVVSAVNRIPIAEIGQNVQHAVAQLDRIASSPEIAQSIRHANDALANLDRAIAAASPQIGPVARNLRQASAALQQTVTSANAIMGAGYGEQDKNIPDALAELSGAARALRSLANYLERHPESLLQGKGASQ